jgi:hypothetical protein
VHPVESAPTGVKLFVNVPNSGFSDVEDLEPAQKIIFREQDLVPGSRVNLKVVKFLHVNRSPRISDRSHPSLVSHCISTKTAEVNRPS